MVAAALLGVLGFLIALRLKDVKPMWGQPGEMPNNPQPQ
jgi:hypothetical protein